MIAERFLDHVVCFFEQLLPQGVDFRGEVRLADEQFDLVGAGGVGDGDLGDVGVTRSAGGRPKQSLAKYPEQIE